MATKATKFDPVKYAEKKNALTELRKPAPPATSVIELRDRVKRLEKVFGV
jgi:hypothetical protein